MRVSVLNTPEEVSPEVIGRVCSDVEQALNSLRTVGDKFIVNDSLFYWRNPSGQMRPSVVNNAKYISGTFQNALVRLGWRKEETIADQKIDAYVELPVTGTAYSIPVEQFPDRSSEYLKRRYPSVAEVPLDTEYVRLYQEYVVRTKYRVSHLPERVREVFTETPIHSPLRVGLEFEVGNIASSFRAINKLDELFRLGRIDLGVLVTSIDKSSSAARIWPISNRNGSFEELRRRGYQNHRIAPSVDIGFAPDGFDKTVGFLGKDLSLYYLRPTGREITVKGVTYREFDGPEGLRYQRVDEI